MNSNDNKVLMLCGLQEIRSSKFAEYLSCYNWHPIIVTSKNPSLFSKSKLEYSDLKDVTVMKTWDIFPFLEIISGILRRFKMNYLINLPDRFIGWIPHTIFKSLKILKENDIKLIFVSCSPYSGALVGACLKKITKKPLAIDLRDSWTLNEYSDYSKSINKNINKKMESWVLKKADLITVVSENMKRDYIESHPFVENKIQVITNGFDFKEIHSCDEQCDKIIFSYIGTIYGKRYEPFEIFTIALSNAIKNGMIPLDKIQINLIGSKRKEIDDIINKYNLYNVIIPMPFLPQNEAISYLFKSHVLLLFEFSDSLTTKIFEYLATGKPILSIMKKGELEEIIESYSDNSYIITSRDILDVENALIDLFKKWQSNAIKYTDQSKSKDVYKKYHRKYLTQALAQNFDALVQK